MYTFKAQAKSNSKRFLTKTSGIADADVNKYLTTHDGQWGTYVDADGKPVEWLVANPDGVEAGDTAPVRTDRHTGIAEEPAVDEARALAAGVLPTQEEADVLAGKAPTQEDEQELAEERNAVNRMFGAFAMAQLTAPSNAAPVETPRPAREGATPTAGLKIQKERVTQNGVTRKSEGTVGFKLFALYDQVGPDITLAKAKELAAAAGLSTTSAAIALYEWRRFNGYESRPVSKSA